MPRDTSAFASTYFWVAVAHTAPSTLASTSATHRRDEDFTMRPFRVSVSPGSTWRRNFAPSMPVRNPMEPSAPRSTRMQNEAACASASMMTTPGSTG